jgi:protein translocase SecG subunit
MVLAFLLADGNAAANAYLIAQIIITALIVIASGFIIFVVMKQSGNSDGTEAFSGGSKDRDRDQDSYYGKNAAGRSEAKLKMWTYICAGILALCAIASVILTSIFA